MHGLIRHTTTSAKSDCFQQLDPSNLAQWISLDCLLKRRNTSNTSYSSRIATLYKHVRYLRQNRRLRLSWKAFSLTTGLYRTASLRISSPILVYSSSARSLHGYTPSLMSRTSSLQCTICKQAGNTKETTEQSSLASDTTMRNNNRTGTLWYSR